MSSPPTALLTFSIGPVHSFISQARKVADLWTGSDVLSRLMAEAIGALPDDAETIFPGVKKGDPPPQGLPNRVVCRLPLERADEIAAAMESAVRGEWRRLAEDATKVLTTYHLEPSPAIVASRQTETVFDLSWSWVPEKGDYSAAYRESMRRHAASRRFRAFEQIEQQGEKCAICGERTALPDGDRERVRERWEAAETQSEETPDQRHLRFDQTRLCLVCATKRFYAMQEDSNVYFSGFDQFTSDEENPYFALVSMDGDRLGETLSWPADRAARGDMERLHRAVSQALTRFSESLREKLHPWRLDFKALDLDSTIGKPPQLIYAGGEDVLLVCDPRDALPLASAIRRRYLEKLSTVRDRLADPGDLSRLTISAAILFAHMKHPAGLVFKEAEDLLHRKAKTEEGRNAVALRLVKRGGVPVETAFKWDGEEGAPRWVESFNELVELVRSRELSSSQTFNLRLEENTLREIFETESQWRGWLANRLSRGTGERVAQRGAELLTPFFRQDKPAALRIVRFLGRELKSPEVPEERI